MRKTHIAVAALGVLALAALVGYRENSLTIRDRRPAVACTMEAKICPDGTAVGRQGPNCEFAPCPQPKPTAPKDPACTGEDHEYFSLGFGVEHRYEGEIAPGKPVVAVLSCDHTRLTLSGSVNQVISGSADADMDEIIADLTAGELVVSLDQDYNFDGYNDLSSVVSNGQGMSAVDYTNVYLYDPASKKFRIHQQISGMENVYPNPESKRIEQEFCQFDEEGVEVVCQSFYHRWRGGYLVEVAS